VLQHFGAALLELQVRAWATRVVGRSCLDLTPRARRRSQWQLCASFWQTSFPTCVPRSTLRILCARRRSDGLSVRVCVCVSAH
jgi:hypothetical protein